MQAVKPLVVYSIFDRPDDFPKHVVMRRFYVGSGGVTPDPIATLYADLLEARNDLPGGLVCFEPDWRDVPALVESWA
jgi:hypothetical protein